MQSTRLFIIFKGALIFQIAASPDNVLVSVLNEDKYGCKQAIARTHQVVIKAFFLSYPTNPYSHLLQYFNKHGWIVKELKSPYKE